MRTPHRALLLLTFLSLAAVASAQINIVNFDFGAVPIQCSNGYAYVGAQTACAYGYPTQNFNGDPGFGWKMGAVAARQLAPTSLEGGAGLTGPDTIFFPPSFGGMPFNQAVFLQDLGGFVWQELTGFTPGSYRLSFYLGSRSGGFSGNQTVVALIDGTPIGTWALTTGAPFALQTVTFTVSTAGSHALEFIGTMPGDNTAFLSYVTITPVTHR
ncbi:MAG TPA: hypothetical protein VK976_11165 [Verrucomicrobiae bacterium]|jgi:hypothetical protein|nr:hypothetical protein [Verrucomicrobiae bacterium]